MRILALLLCLAVAVPAAADPINAVLGDASWRATYGAEPRETAEVARIQTHLRYVLALLRSRPSTPPRAAALDALARYIERGVFPRRTDDGFLGRRPRFIDDRGVHCAVGQLIADTGYPELARAINAEHEYDYVPDIDTPGLREWTAATGFTVDELAMIQPTYGFEEDCNRDPWQPVVSARDSLLIACAATHAPLDNVPLVLTTTTSDVKVTTTSTDPFAQCFATLATEAVRSGGSGRCDILPKTRRETVLSLPAPQDVLAERVTKVELDTDCWPRPGVLARRAAIDVTLDENGLAVSVVTTPRNREVDACIARGLRDRLHDFELSQSKLHATSLRALPARTSAGNMHHVLAQQGQLAATKCYPATKPASRLDLRATARTDDAAFAITVGTRDESFARCVSGELAVRLPKSLSVAGQFRIDADVDVAVTVPVESTSDRERRFRKLRDEARRPRIRGW